MTAFGYSLICEEHHPVDLIANARRAELVGFEFVTISDHFHPWLESQAHSPYAWSVLGALAATTDRVDSCRSSPARSSATTRRSSPSGRRPSRR